MIIIGLTNTKFFSCFHFSLIHFHSHFLLLFLPLSLSLFLSLALSNNLITFSLTFYINKPFFLFLPSLFPLFIATIHCVEKKKISFKNYKNVIKIISFFFTNFSNVISSVCKLFQISLLSSPLLSILIVFLNFLPFSSLSLFPPISYSLSLNIFLLFLKKV